uniref:Thymosin beta n=1 Tax=Trichogramma kaykai TaxID=54128 RepID=A0ABD2VXY6_9HYME
MSDPTSPSLKNLPKVAVDLKSELEGFDHSNMKRAEVKVKNVLPSAEDLAAAKTQQTLIAGIEKFDTSRLKHTETNEKNPLPDKEIIEQEKGKQQLMSGIENFNPSQLKHAETLEKNPLPTKEGTNSRREASMKRVSTSSITTEKSLNTVMTTRILSYTLLL